MKADTKELKYKQWQRDILLSCLFWYFFVVARMQLGFTCTSCQLLILPNTAATGIKLVCLKQN